MIPRGDDVIPLPIRTYPKLLTAVQLHDDVARLSVVVQRGDAPADGAGVDWLWALVPHADDVGSSGSKDLQGTQRGLLGLAFELH